MTHKEQTTNIAKLSPPSLQEEQQVSVVTTPRRKAIKLHLINGPTIDPTRKTHFDDGQQHSTRESAYLRNDFNKIRKSLIRNLRSYQTLSTQHQGHQGTIPVCNRSSQAIVKYIDLNKTTTPPAANVQISKSQNLKFKFINRLLSNSSIEIEKSFDYDTCKPGDKVIEINDKPLGHYTLDDLDDLLNSPNGINTLKIETQGQLVTNDPNNNNNNSNGIILNTIETVHKGLFNDLAKGRMRDCCMDQEYVLDKASGEQIKKRTHLNAVVPTVANRSGQQTTNKRRSHSLPNAFDIDSLLEYLSIRKIRQSSNNPFAKTIATTATTTNASTTATTCTIAYDQDYLNRIINTTTTTTQTNQQVPRIIHQPCKQQQQSNLNVTRINIRRARSFRDLTTHLVQQPHQVYHLNELIFNEKIGEGFFAYVKKITHRHTGKTMVIKELKLGDQPLQIEREYEYMQAYNSFLKEAQILRNLKHPNIIKFYGVLFTKDRHLNLILEYISGGTLKDIIHNLNHLLPWKLRVSYAKDISYGMDYLHSLNIIHRDLKSDNCLVRQNGSVVIADFGLSRVIEDDTLTNLNKACDVHALAPLLPKEQQQQQVQMAQTECGTSLIVETKKKLKRRVGARKQRYAVVGNSFSMAPEMLKHQMYDERVDIFSFGILCCEIIGRVEADPDYLPRTTDFGLNVELFRKKYCEADCPKHFIQIAIACCELEPDTRPPFSKLHPWLETILLHLEANNPIPKNLLKNILNTNQNQANK